MNIACRIMEKPRHEFSHKVVEHVSLGKSIKLQNLFETPIKKQLLRCCSFQ